MMKLILSFLLAITTVITSFANQPENVVDSSYRQDEGWRERMRSEQIAFLTAEIGLTPTEAEKFWPIYNQIEKEKHRAVNNVWNTFHSLQRALESNASEAEIDIKLKAYAKALEIQSALEGVQIERYGRLLSKEKIARLYVAEEKFRRQQIRRLHAPQVDQKKK